MGYMRPLIRQALGRAAVPWTPARLFAGGADGVWCDPSDLSTVWQDSAGTTPAAVNDPVGRIDDKSGNGNHATQATTAAKPYLRDTSGLKNIEFDGVDDRLDLGSILSFGTLSCSAWAVIKITSFHTSSRCCVWSRRGTGAPGTNKGWGYRVDNNGRYRIEYDDGSGNSYADAAIGNAGDVPINTVVITSVEFDRDAGEIRAYTDGSLVASTSIAGFGDVAGISQLRFGAPGNSDSPNVYLFSGNFYGGIVHAGIPSDAQRALITRWLASISGKTL